LGGGDELVAVLGEDRHQAAMELRQALGNNDGAVDWHHGAVCWMRFELVVPREKKSGLGRAPARRSFDDSGLDHGDDNI
jgi:hypothetical protein